MTELSLPIPTTEILTEEDTLFEQPSEVVSTASLPVGSSDPFDYYFRYPYLSLEQEQDLSRKFTRTGCLKAAHQLVLAHMRYVVKLAKNYTSYGLPLQDLVQEGAMGLMKAVQRFDPYQGVRLVSFAVHWIKSEIHEYIIRNWRLVKIATTKAQRKLFFNLRRLVAKKQQQAGTAMAEGGFAQMSQWHQEIADELDVPLEEVHHMAQRFQDQEIAFEQPTAGQDEGLNLTQLLPSNSASPAEEVLSQKDRETTQKQLSEALIQLSDRDQVIIKERFYQEKKTTFKELAQRYNISVERVRQLEKSALNRLKQLMA